MAIVVSLFGRPHVTDVSGDHDVAPRKPALLLLYLAAAGGWVNREELTRVFRSRTDDAASRGSVRLLLTRARHLPWAAGLEADTQRVRWAVPTDVQAWHAARRAGRWEEVVETYAPLLAGVAMDDTLPGLNAWLDAERAALHGAWRDAVDQLERLLLARGEAARTARMLARVLTHDPLAEDILRRYLDAARVAGLRDEALRAYETFEARLAGDLGLSPLPATLALVAALRTGTASIRLPHTPAEGAARPGCRGATLPDALTHPVLVGREHVLAGLSRTDRPVVLLVGEPGIGKTRALAEVSPGLLPLRCQEGLERVPYHPLIAAVRARLGRLPNLGPYLADLARLMPDVHVGAPPLAADDGEDAGRERVLEALCRVFAPEGRVVVDDLQWADAATLEWLVYAAGRGLRILGAYRRSEVGAALEATLRALAAFSTVVTVEPLNGSDVATLTAVVTGRPEAGPLGPWLHDRSGGNPLLALEWLRAVWQQAGELAAVPTAAQLAALPATPRLRDLLLRRADALDVGDRRVLDLAAVLGGDLRADHMARVLDASAWDVAAALARAERSGLLRGEQLTHDTVRTALLGALPDVQRRLLHARVAATLEGALDDLVVAEHAAQAGEEALAARLWWQVATRGLGVRPGFEEEAVHLYERVLALNVRTPEWYRSCAYLAERYRVAGRVPQVGPLIDTVLRESDDLEARAMAQAVAAMLAYLDGNLTGAGMLVAAAAQAAAALGDARIEDEVRLMEVRLAYFAGDLQRAEGTARMMLERERHRPLSVGLCNWLGTLGAVLCDLDRPADALDLYREQLAAAQALKLRGQQVTASSDIIATLHDLGRIQEGVPIAEAALALGHVYDSYPLRYHLALAYGRGGRSAEALAHAQAVRDGSPSVNMRAHAYALLTELHHAAHNAAALRNALESGLTEIEACDLGTARAVLVTAAVRFGPDDLQPRARAAVAALDAAALPPYLRGDFVAALAARPPAPSPP